MKAGKNGSNRLSSERQKNLSKNKGPLVGSGWVDGMLFNCRFQMGCVSR